MVTTKMELNQGLEPFVGFLLSHSCLELSLFLLSLECQGVPCITVSWQYLLSLLPFLLRRSSLISCHTLVTTPSMLFSVFYLLCGVLL